MISERTSAEASWQDVKQQLLQRWNELSHQELDRLRGNTEQLYHYLQDRTGEARDVLEQYVEKMLAASGTSLEEVSAQARKYAEYAAEGAQEFMHQTADQLRASYIQTERMVRRHPVEAVACTLATGIVCGLLLGLSLRSR